MRKQCARDVYLPLNKSYLRVSNIKNLYFRTAMTPSSSSPWWPFRSFPPHQSRPRARNVSLCVCKLAYHRKASRVWDEKWLGVDGFLVASRFLVESGEDLQGEPLTAWPAAVRPDYITFFFDLLLCDFFFQILKSLVWLLRNNIYSKLKKMIASRALRESQKNAASQGFNRTGRRGPWFPAAYCQDTGG